VEKEREKIMKERSKFTSKIGFVMAAAGSAVGLGNIWRFPYLAAQYGGGGFLFVYIILAVTFGFTLMVSEIALGRKTRVSAIGAYKKLNKKFAFEGVLTALVPIIIFPYYSVINGWVLKYCFVYLTGQNKAAAKDGFFTSFITETWEPLFWFLLCMVFVLICILAGVVKGIEAISKTLMSILVVLMIIIAIFVIMTPGAGAGIKYYLVPEFGNFSAKTLLAAVGQLFYSLSLAMGIMITYGSYMKDEDNLESSVRQIEVFDTIVAFLAGLMIIPSVFAFSKGDPSVLSSGPSLMFVTLPKAFEKMLFGRFIGLCFFIMVFFAASTSAISLMEAVTSIFMDQFAISRAKAAAITAAYSLVLGGIASLGYGPLANFKILGMQALDLMDFVSNSILMPVVSIVTCIFVGYVIKPEAIISEVEKNGEKFKGKKMFVFITKYIAPWFILAVFISSIAQAAGVFKL
jgi:NSS family neurotransmitter:Na+ symporter